LADDKKRSSAPPCVRDNGVMNTQEQLDRLGGIVDALAASVVHHDDQIRILMKVAQKHQDGMTEMLELREEQADD
jgi:hypothetical protein